MRIKGKRATVGITLPPELVEKARKYGLNISKIAENALRDMIERIEGAECGKGRPKGGLAGSEGFEPSITSSAG